MDRIALTGIEVVGHHGVLPSEREQGQRFVVDAVLELDLDPAATSDDLVDTVDYGTLADDIAGLVAGAPVDLLETLAARVAERCLRDRRVGAAEVTVHKPDVLRPLVRDVSVTLRRERT